MNRSKKKVLAKLMAIAICFAMVFGVLPTMGAPAYAAEDPAPIENSYEIDGMHYVKIEGMEDDEQFSVSPFKFFEKALRAGTTLVGDLYEDEGVEPKVYGWDEAWRYLSLYIVPERFFDAKNSADKSSLDYYLSLAKQINGGDFRQLDYNNASWIYRNCGLKSANSMAQAEYNALETLRGPCKVYQTGSNPTTFGPGDLFNTLYLNNTENRVFAKETAEQPVFYNCYATYHYNNSLGYEMPQDVVVIFFSDFKVSPLLPEDKGKNYIKEDKEKDVSRNTVASNVRNLTGETVRADQGITKTTSATVSSEINGSESYGFEESLTIGAGTNFGVVEASMEIGFTASQTVEKGWVEGKASTDEETTEHTVGVDLPPYTTVMMTQNSSTIERVSKYNCPVSISCKVRIMTLDPDDRGKLTDVAQFTSHKDLYNRAIVNRNYADKENIDWRSLSNKDKLFDEVLEAAACVIPMGSTNAHFKEVVKSVSGEVSGIKPTYALDRVQVAEKVHEYQMSVGDYAYLDDIELKGINTVGGSYYGFDSSKGHWEIVDENGNDTSDESIADIKATPAGLSKMTAKGPGKVYLKYFIDEDCYDIAENAGANFRTNAQLSKTAMIEVNVSDIPFSGQIDVTGSFTGYVGDDFATFTGENGLNASVMDDTGKELDRMLTWEAKELPAKGIEVQGNTVKFTKEGTFHVRAVSGDVKSDWIEIKSERKVVKATFDFCDGSEPEVIEGREGDMIVAPETKNQCAKIDGWYKNTDLTGDADLEDKGEFELKENVNFYAKTSQNHSMKETAAVEATCKTEGNDAYWTCEKCEGFFDKDGNAIEKDSWITPATGHDYGKWEVLNNKQHKRVCTHDPAHIETANHVWDKGKITTAATTKAEGVKTFTCKYCPAKRTESLPKLISGTLMSKMAVKGKDGITMTWTAIAGADGYDVFFAQCNHKKKENPCKLVKSIKAGKTLNFTKTGLKKNTAYKVICKAYALRNGKKTYVRTSPDMHIFTTNGTKNYTNIKAVTVNKTKVSLSKGKTFNIKATAVKADKKKKVMANTHTPTLRYLTTNKNVATVSGSGKITAKGKGTCSIYVYAHNGVSKTVKVTVK